MTRVIYSLVLFDTKIVYVYFRIFNAIDHKNGIIEQQQFAAQRGIVETMFRSEETGVHL